ncbi:uncharacterized protein LOC117581600 isoform X2 [Drosophila guanche]|uniref:Blast:RNA-binding protein with serine-rich domain 1 n=1 Tax=Drosophila guanche TaxID=7266 RepID=A0A3B0K0T0_DROGU|nr:uncharacterized protein LOC117581600 isoform X2 [Drosophila guanche]SPP78621.1 blast:RNA-binding protein with serine-rich domain 1 [Drosophila guanche]
MSTLKIKIEPTEDESTDVPVHYHYCQRETCNTHFDGISGKLISVGTQTEGALRQTARKESTETNYVACGLWPKPENPPAVKKEAPEASVEPVGDGASQLPDKSMAPLRSSNRGESGVKWTNLDGQVAHAPCIHAANLEGVPLSSVKIFITGISPFVTREEIGEVFGWFGNIKLIEYPSNRHPSNPQGRGYAFVQYVCPMDCTLAIEKMNGRKLGLGKIEVMPIKPKKKRAPFTFRFDWS